MEIINRFKSKTPLFFKKLRNIALSVSALCGTLSVSYSQLPSEFSAAVPAVYIKIIAVSALVAAGVAQLTKE